MDDAATPLDHIDPSRSRWRQSPAFLAILRDYRALLATIHAELRTALESGDEQTLHRHLHRVKGTAAGYGFQDLSTSATACERLLKDSAPIDAAASSFRAREFDLLLERLAIASEVTE